MRQAADFLQGRPIGGDYDEHNSCASLGRVTCDNPGSRRFASGLDSLSSCLISTSPQIMTVTNRSRLAFKKGAPVSSRVRESS